MNQGKTATAIPVFHRVSDLSEWVKNARLSGLKIGFVPTMGALHAGHASLVHRATETCDLVVVSVFVNPTQFNDASDYNQYPLTPESDLAVVDRAGGAAVFMPTVEEIYDGVPAVDSVDMGRLTQLWEAADRPGHFDGVVAIVDRLFQAVQPDFAFFGEKDLQQLAVVRAMSAERHPAIGVVGCPLVRDDDGLALSSRNVRLSAANRSVALALSASLFRLRDDIAEGADPEEALAKVRRALDATEGVTVAYLDLVQRDTFDAWETGVLPPVFAILAATVGGVRLLDNLEVIS